LKKRRKKVRARDLKRGRLARRAGDKIALSCRAKMQGRGGRKGRCPSGEGLLVGKGGGLSLFHKKPRHCSQTNDRGGCSSRRRQGERSVFQGIYRVCKMPWWNPCDCGKEGKKKEGTSLQKEREGGGGEPGLGSTLIIVAATAKEKGKALYARDLPKIP